LNFPNLQQLEYVFLGKSKLVNQSYIKEEMNMKKDYQIIATEDGKFRLQVDKQIIKLCGTDIPMETDKRELLEKIAIEMDPGLYRLEDGDIIDQYIPAYFILSKVLFVHMDDSDGMFDNERFHWIISSDPFFHLVAGPESIDQRVLLQFAFNELEKAGGTYADLPQVMAIDAEQMEEYRNNPDYYIDKNTADIIKEYFLRLDAVKKGVFYHLWSSTSWNVWVPLLWLNELCTDEEYCNGVAATRALIPTFSDVSKKSFKELKDSDLEMLNDCREII